MKNSLSSFLLLFITVITCVNANGQGNNEIVELWGMTSQGGTYDQGVIFKYIVNTNTYEKVFEFDGSNGSEPTGSLIQADNGKLYGMTSRGGIYDGGVVFEFDPLTSDYRKVDLGWGMGGANPTGSLVMASDGNLYGMNSNGGLYGFGTLYSILYGPSGGFSLIEKIHFNETNGAYPFGDLVEASNGLLYGMTSGGGNNNRGIIFYYNISTETLVKVRDLDDTLGSIPHGSLVEASDGQLYGMTSSGGDGGAGALFKFTLVGFTIHSYVKQHDFIATSGGFPEGSLIQAADGLLYGMTKSPARLFSFDYSSLTYNNIHTFAAGTEASGSLTLSSSGDSFYGMTTTGGSYGYGMIYQYDGSRHVLYSFRPADGAYPKYSRVLELHYADTDHDLVPDEIDLCPSTPEGEDVNENGCAQSQLDDDNDAVMNDMDLCPDTPQGETPDANGCSESQLDDDNDGVMNDVDFCPNTHPGETTDEHGCSESQLDDDYDGVMNDADLCPNTPPGEIGAVDANGCSESQLDDDNDGVMNDVDLCPDTPQGETPDANGCSESQLDEDNDGVMNNADLCPDTPPGEPVNATGCPENLITYIPDERFERALIDSRLDSDGTINQQVLTSDIDTVTELDVDYRAIGDLTGIEDFTALEILKCSDNDLTFLNLTQNIHLKELECYRNSLTSLDLSHNLQLTRLVCPINQISALNLSNNSALSELVCGSNQLTDLDLTNNQDLIGLAFQGNQLSAIDLSTNIQLTHLNCATNLITVLDVSGLTNLVWLGCGMNQLTSLDLSQNSTLSTVFCSENQLYYLNVKNGNNDLISVFDATSNPSLGCIEVDDATAATAGSGSYASWLIDATASYSDDCNPPDEDNDTVPDYQDDCPNTPAGETVDVKGCSESQIQYTSIPDANFEQALIDLGIDSDGELNQRVATDDIFAIESLDVRSKNISDLTGIEDFVSLTYLNCMENNLSELILDNNKLLVHLNCNTNQLTSLDISNDTLISYFDCSVNYISVLDLSKNSAMNRFYCTTNELIYLNVNNGNNEAITEFYALDNPDLKCIKVDNPVSANAGIGIYSTWHLDPATGYSDNCSMQSLRIEDDSPVLVFPNPTNGIFTLELPNHSLPVKIEIFDSSSNLILKEDYEIKFDKTELNIVNQPAGIYFVKVYLDLPVIVKIIKL